MPKINFDEYIDQDFSTNFESRRQRREKIKFKKGHAPKGRDEIIEYQADLVEHASKIPEDITQHFTPTLKAKSHEQYWLLNYLESFYNDKIITDVLSKVKGGKEANVYCCEAHPSTGYQVLAAKIYRPRMFRNLRNDVRYRQGRLVRDEEGKVASGRREVLAMQKNTRFGQVLRHSTWLDTEFQTLKRLHAAGADVPKPVTSGSSVIIMEYAGYLGEPAPALNQVSLASREARRVFDRILENLEIFLANHCVHGDLSAYNVLYWDNEFRIIDFPQTVDPRHNPDARPIFQRDVERLCQYFARNGIRQDPTDLAERLWSRYERVNALDAGILDEGEE